MRPIDLVADSLLVAGQAAMIVGLWLAWPPLGWMAGGAGLIGCGLLVAWTQRRG
jgi:hypothetical protein